MDKELFLKEISLKASKYAREIVCNPEEHEDAVQTITEDFIEGASAAYDLLTNLRHTKYDN